MNNLNIFNMVNILKIFVSPQKHNVWKFETSTLMRMVSYTYKKLWNKLEIFGTHVKYMFFINY